jgi:hypothetical protein
MVDAYLVAGAPFVVAGFGVAVVISAPILLAAGFALLRAAVLSIVTLFGRTR